MRSTHPCSSAFAMPKEVENSTRPTASSIATTISSRWVSGPSALYCLTTIRVAAGSVAAAIAPSVIADAEPSQTQTPQKERAQPQIANLLRSLRETRCPKIILSVQIKSNIFQGVHSCNFLNPKFFLFFLFFKFYTYRFK